jgi:purine nucleosidase
MAAAPPIRVVIDCDPGVDDAMAIYYGLLAPEIEIVALTCVWGNIWVEPATDNACRLLEIGGRTDIPVAMGAAKPLIGPLWNLLGGVHGDDGQGNTNPSPPATKPVAESAVHLLIRLAHEAPGELTLVPIGPLTNVAMALAADPAIARLYKEVVIMGGNFQHPGNASKWGEANIWHDPEAAQIVLEAGWPITLVGLDVTMTALLNESQLADLGRSDRPEARHLNQISQYYLDRYAARRGVRECSMHDALALAIAADPSLVLEAPLTRVDVELTGTHTRGMTVAELRAGRGGRETANARVVLKVDAARFIDRWMRVVTGQAL